MKRLLALAALILAAFACYGGPTILDLGFYHDDWFTLSIIRFAPDALPLRMEALARTDVSQLFRPFVILLWPSLYTLLGTDPLKWQVLLLAVNLGVALLAAAVMRRFRAPLWLALLGGMLLLAYPSKDANLFWPLNVINPLSLLFCLAGHLAFLSFVESGGAWRLAAASAALLLSLATYDQTVFLPLCWVITPRLFEDGIPPRARRGLILAAGIIAAFVAYKLVFVTHWFQVPFRKGLLLSPVHFVKVYLAGLNASFGPRLAGAVLSACWSVLLERPVAALLALALPWACLARFWKEEREEGPGPSPDALVFLGAAVFALGYLPVALSEYTPTPLNHQNRLNLAPALGIVLAAVGCAAGARPPGASRLRPALALLAGLFLASSAGFAGVWAESYRRQTVLVALLQRNLGAWPADKVLLVRLPERYVKAKAPVFDAFWDLTGALRLATGELSRRARVVSPRMRFEPSAIVEPGYPDLPYGEALYLDEERGTLEPAAFDALSRLPRPR